MAKIILITHQKGGVGKSTLTFNLAQNLSEHSKVAILDIDAQGSLSQLAKIVDSFEITTDENILLTNDHLDFIFVDTPPYLSSKLKELIKIADLLNYHSDEQVKANVDSKILIGNFENSILHGNPH